MHFNWKPVSLRRYGQNQQNLPSVWNRLKGEGINPLILDRVTRFACNEEDKGRLNQFEEFLTILGESFLPNAFDISRFKARDENIQTRRIQYKHFMAIDELSQEFAGLVPAVLWNTLAAMGARPNPTKDDSILNVQEHLPYPWYICDGALHGWSLANALFLHTQSVLCAQTGHILIHGCGCNHYMQAMGSGFVNVPLDEQKRGWIAKEFLDHLIGQTVLIVAEGYPFCLNDEDAQSTRILSLRPAGEMRLQ